MIENKILLSIAVPTYNRPQEFKRMLLGLLPQLTFETELIVKDDSTTFDTKEIFDEFKKNNPQATFSYFKGEKDIGGVDAAYLFLIQNSIGKYIWWFGDDDEFLPGSVEKVLNLLRKHKEISFIWANFCCEKIDNLAIKNRDDGFFRNGNEILEEIGSVLGFLSSLIFKREEAIPALPLAKKYVVGFSFANLIAILQVISGDGKFYFLNGPIFMNHPTTIDEIKKKVVKDNNIIENEGFSVFGVDYYYIIKEFENKFSRSSIRKILSKNFASLWRGMLVGWVGGWDTPKGKRWRMFQLYWSFPEFWIAIPFFLTPLYVNKFFYKIYKIFFSYRKFIFLKNIHLFFKKLI